MKKRRVIIWVCTAVAAGIIIAIGTIIGLRYFAVTAVLTVSHDGLTTTLYSDRTLTCKANDQDKLIFSETLSIETYETTNEFIDQAKNAAHPDMQSPLDKSGEADIGEIYIQIGKTAYTYSVGQDDRWLHAIYQVVVNLEYYYTWQNNP
ncbi:MAG: hypothetical protein FWF44_08315 [Defluviitaleaceae bacterium]|nr:hypothetical protein [Defluviitaleaceae bacterium]